MKGGELEEVIFFMHRLGDAAAGGAGVAGLRPIDIEFVGNAVLAGVRALVNVAIVANAAEQFLHAFFVTLFGGADEIIVRDSHPLPELAEFQRNLIGILLRSLAGGLRGALNLLAVLVGAGKKKSVRTQQTLPSRNRVASDGGVSMADVRPSVHVVNRGCDVKLSAHMILNHRGHSVSQRIVGVLLG